MLNSPDTTYTVEQFIAFKDSDPLTYHNLAILARSISYDGLTFSSNNIIYDYLDELKEESVLVSMSDYSYMKYCYKPKLLAYDLYGATELYFVILALNNTCNIKDFNFKSLYLIEPEKLLAILNVIYNSEINYIKFNRNSIDLQEA